MGRYGKALDQLDNGLFIKLVPGKTTRLRILDDPVVQNQSYKDPQTGQFGAPRTVFSWPVWDYEKQQVRILSKGASVLKQVDEVMDAWNVQNMPMSCDIVITQTGQNLQTRYSVQGVPFDMQLPQAQNYTLPDMQKHIQNGIPITQFANGTKPQVQNIQASTDDDDSTDDGYVPDQPPIGAYDPQSEMPVDTEPDWVAEAAELADGSAMKSEPIDEDSAGALIADIETLKLPAADMIRMLKDNAGIVALPAVKRLNQEAFYKLREAVDKKMSGEF